MKNGGNIAAALYALFVDLNVDAASLGAGRGVVVGARSDRDDSGDTTDDDQRRHRGNLRGCKRVSLLGRSRRAEGSCEGHDRRDGRDLFHDYAPVSE